MRETIVILGGRSEIGVAVARRLAPGATVVLAARRSGDLAAEVQAVRDAGAVAVDTVEFDADDLPAQRGVLDAIVERHGSLDVVVVAFGILGDQTRAEHDAEHARAIVHTDYVAHVTVLTHLAQILRAQGSGTVVVFSSVAGARVRRANYVYGSAKAGLDGFASGLADALHGSGVRLLLVRPGFVIGRMTDGHVARAAVVDPRRGRRRHGRRTAGGPRGGVGAPGAAADLRARPARAPCTMAAYAAMILLATDS